MTTPMEMLASIFKDITRENDSWREPIARCLDDIADGLAAGLPPEEVEIICRGAARSIRNPGRLRQIEKETRAAVKDRSEQK